MSRNFQLLLTKPRGVEILEATGLPPTFPAKATLPATLTSRLPTTWEEGADWDADWADYPDHFCVACGLCKVPGCGDETHAAHHCDSAEGRVRFKSRATAVDELLTPRFRQLERMGV